MDTLRSEVGGIWEEKLIELYVDYELSEYDESCPHVVERDGKRYIPYVVCGINEGGHNSVGICLDCANELRDA